MIGGPTDYLRRLLTVSQAMFCLGGIVLRLSRNGIQIGRIPLWGSALQLLSEPPSSRRMATVSTRPTRRDRHVFVGGGRVEKGPG
jgi:hypothetical protein